MADSKTWNDVPHTDPKATVVKHRRVVDVMAIRVEKASIRLATVSDWFEVADVANPFCIVDGKLTVEVKCYWYGLKPKTTWTHLTLCKKYELIPNHTGEVVANIGDK
jgi:hypothetical protein